MTADNKTDIGMQFEETVEHKLWTKVAIAGVILNNFAFTTKVIVCQHNDIVFVKSLHNIISPIDSALTRTKL